MSSIQEMNFIDKGSLLRFCRVPALATSFILVQLNVNFRFSGKIKELSVAYIFFFGVEQLCEDSLPLKKSSPLCKISPQFLLFYINFSNASGQEQFRCCTPMLHQIFMLASIIYFLTTVDWYRVGFFCGGEQGCKLKKIPSGFHPIIHRLFLALILNRICYQVP